MLSDLAEMAIARCQRPFGPPLPPISTGKVARATTADDLSWFERRWHMAKGQKRSNREQRKPKKAPAPAKPETVFGAQVKAATDAGRRGGVK